MRSKPAYDLSASPLSNAARFQDFSSSNSFANTYPNVTHQSKRNFESIEGSPNELSNMGAQRLQVRETTVIARNPVTNESASHISTIHQTNTDGKPDPIRTTFSSVPKLNTGAPTTANNLQLDSRFQSLATLDTVSLPNLHPNSHAFLSDQHSYQPQHSYNPETRLTHPPSQHYQHTYPFIDASGFHLQQNQQFYALDTSGNAQNAKNTSINVDINAYQRPQVYPHGGDTSLNYVSGRHGQLYSVKSEVLPPKPQLPLSADPKSQVNRPRPGYKDGIRNQSIKQALFCHQCTTQNSPEWRKGPDGPKTFIVI